MSAARIGKYLGLIAAVILMAAMLIWDPGAKPEHDDGKIHVRYWHTVGMNDVVPPYVTMFNESQDSVVVDITLIPWQEHEKKILTSVLSGDPPDVVSQFVPVPRWASRMALRPLNDLMEETDFDPSIVFPALWEEMQWSDLAFGVPLKTSSYAFFYNKRLFREAGLDPERPPRTWDEVKAYSKRLYRVDDQGHVASVGYLPEFSPSHPGILGNMSTASIMAWQLGAKYLSDDGRRLNLKSPEVLRAVHWTRDFYEDYDIEAIQAFVGGLGTGEQHGFLTEKLAMIILDMSFLRLIALNRPDLEYGVVATPSFEGYPTASVAGSWWLGIPRGAKSPRAAWAFMQFAMRKDVQLKEIQMRDDNLFPANRAAAADSSFASAPFMQVFVDQMEYAHSPTIAPLAHGVFWREFYGALERSTLRIETPEEAFDEAESRIQDAIDRAGSYDEFVRSKMAFLEEGQ